MPFSSKKPDVLDEWLILGLEKEMYKKSLKTTLSYQKANKPLEVCQKRFRRHLEEVPTGQS